MTYIVILFCLIIISFISIFSKRRLNFLFLIFGSIITFLSVFRYGIGTDYFEYFRYYKINPKSILESLSNNYHIDFGYSVIMSISKKMNLSFQTFILIVSLFIVGIFLYTIYENSKLPMVSLMIFYSSYYLIYVNSAIRQGIAMSIFIYAFFKYFKDEKYTKYILAVLFASMFHKSALITLLVPLIGKLYEKFFKNVRFNLAIILFSFIIYSLKADRVILVLVNVLNINIKFQINNINIVPIMFRLLMLIIIFAICKLCGKDRINDFQLKCIYIYFINVLIFISISNIPLLSRLFDYIGLLEIFIFSNLLYNLKRREASIIFIAVFIIFSVNFIKDEYSFLKQGFYYGNSVLNYEYVSVFDKERIYKIRRVKIYY